MKKIFKYQSLSKIIYFIFYILINTSGILSIFFLLTTFFMIFQAIFYPDAYLIRDLGSNLLLGLPPVGMVIVSFIVMQRVRQAQMFFTLTFIIISISHFLLSQSTNIQLKDIRLVLAAILYVGFLSLTLTICRERIITQKNYKESFMLLIVMIVEIIINLNVPKFLMDAYLSFAWGLNNIDYLFSKLNLFYGPIPRSLLRTVL